ncbi:hypothetical protein Sjap_002141 [Stephania japonica]|uniref:Uncharacterized protein n=1 Tax=Stephania japonica TaxID=461633 RepID=A0AAP0PVT3_9MAGN
MLLCLWSVTCILRWATYIKNPICPQCKNPFEFLILHRALDGRIHDYMLEESVCLLLRANWFEPLRIVVREEVTDEREDYYPYEEDEDDCMDDFYFSGASSLRIGNRRWGSNGYVRTGRREARPVSREGFQDPDHTGSSRSTPNKKKEVKVGNGRRAKRAMKREAADKAAATAATAVTAANAAATVTAAKG